MPPDDYDSWLLAHIIFKCDATNDPNGQADKIFSHLSADISESHAA
jgi:hypothetical protein